MWPVMHPCGIATVNCSEFDRAFDQYGVIKRQCTKEGVQSVKLGINLHPTPSRLGTCSGVCCASRLLKLYAYIIIYVHQSKNGCVYEGICEVSINGPECMTASSQLHMLASKLFLVES